MVLRSGFQSQLVSIRNSDAVAGWKTNILDQRVNMARSIVRNLTTICVLAGCFLLPGTISGQSLVGAARTMLVNHWLDDVAAAVVQHRPQTPCSHKDSLRLHKRSSLVYHRGEDSRLTLDVDQREGTVPFPVVLAVHGGAWQGGRKCSLFRHSRKLASAGNVVVSINQRHSPKHPFPAQKRLHQASRLMSTDEIDQ